MDEKPTVQMDSYQNEESQEPEQGQKPGQGWGQGMNPTVPMEDAFPQGNAFPQRNTVPQAPSTPPSGGPPPAPAPPGPPAPTIPASDAFRQQSWSAPPPPAQMTPAHGINRPPVNAWGEASPQQTPPGQGQQPPSHEARGGTMVMGAEEAVSAWQLPLAWLAIFEGPGGPRGQVYSLGRETLIGRAAGQVMLGGDNYVSAQHAKIRLETVQEEEPKRQAFILYDMASANGTYAGDRDTYDEERVYRHELQDGDFILIGETTLVFKQV